MMGPDLLRYRGVRCTVLLFACALLVGPASALTSLCEPEERTLWSCERMGKTYALCASRSADASAGYMQYRVGNVGAVEFSYPEALKHPKSAFRFSLLAKGASLAFENAGYDYSIYEPLMGRTTINVRKNDRDLSTFECESATETLTLTTTINRMEDWGIAN